MRTARIRVAVVSMSVGAVLALTGAGPAQAVPGGPPVEWTLTDPTCRSQGFTTADCTITGTSVIKAPLVLTAVDLASAEVSSLKAADGTTLAQAAAAATVRYRDWSMSATSVLWKETHTGRTYWDGHHVWTTSTHYGKKGNHDCDNGYAVGGDIQILACTTNQEYGAGQDVTDKWKATGIAKGFPFSSTHRMIFHPNGNGTYNKSWS